MSGVTLFLLGVFVGAVIMLVLACLSMKRP